MDCQESEESTEEYPLLNWVTHWGPWEFLPHL